MNRKLAVFAALTTIAALLPVRAFGDAVDWKFYGVAHISAGDQFCFYDERSISKSPSGIKVWIKCLKIQDLRPTGKETFAASVLGLVRDRVRGQYVPPYAFAGKTNKDTLFNLLVAESMADVGSATPTVRAFIEIDCAGRKSRWLQLTAGERTTSENSGWEDIAPETNSSTLRQMTCS